MALNEALMIRRRLRGDTISLEDAGDDALSVEETAASDEPTADKFVEAAHARALLEHAIDALPDNFRTVFMLRAVEGLDVRETAECLGINGATVRTRLFQQRQLRTLLSRRLESERGDLRFGAERCDRSRGPRAREPGALTTRAPALRAGSPANASRSRARWTR